jgi:hypothetical protein
MRCANAAVCAAVRESIDAQTPRVSSFIGFPKGACEIALSQESNREFGDDFVKSPAASHAESVALGKA